MQAGGPLTDDSGVHFDGGEISGDMGGESPASGTNQSRSARAASSVAGTAGGTSAWVEAVIQSLQK